MKNVRLKLIGLFGLIASIVFAQSTLPLGAGTEVDPYLISNAEELTWVSENSSSWNSHFLQTADVDISYISNWTPIGNSSNYFTGTYDGGDFTVQNVTINRSDDYQGLFGFIDGDGTIIKNLGVTSVNITGGWESGALCGRINNNAFVQDCFSTGVVFGASANTSSGQCHKVGGLVGESRNAHIIRCYSTCDVTNNYGGQPDFTNLTGGLLGNNINGSTLTESFALGNVVGGTATGGLVGSNRWSNATISNCYAMGSVSGLDDVGGLSGAQESSVDNSIINCYSTGNVTGSIAVGGFIGRNNSGIVTDCYWDTEISSITVSSGGQGKSTIEMTDENTYSLWDINGIWKINSTINSGYPYLAWEENISGATATTQESVSYAVGDLVQGGIVFHVDEAEGYGLVVATQDIGAYYFGCFAFNDTEEIVGADGTAIGTGYQNTLDIVASCSETPIAASECLAYESEGYSDWYLPSIDELDLIYNNIYVGQGNPTNYPSVNYLSSSEANPQGVWQRGFGTWDDWVDWNWKEYQYPTLPVRTFSLDAVSPVSGCTNPVASNYNPDAIEDDDSCIIEMLSYQPGDFAQGGIVFHIDEEAGYGLAAAPQDLEGVQQFGCEGVVFQQANGYEIGTGMQNSIEISEACPGTNVAATNSLAYENEGYSDWFLPSPAAVEEMYNSIGQPAGNIGGFQEGWYWTSKTYDHVQGYLFHFSENGWMATSNKGYGLNARPIRMFSLDPNIYGCMDTIALNYNPEATADDASCEYVLVNHQWASWGVSSSTYSGHTDDEQLAYTAWQATGEPNAACNDNHDTWLAGGGNDNWLEMSFDTAVYAMGLTVVENNAAGFISKIEAVDTLGNYHLVWEGVDPGNGFPQTCHYSEFEWETTPYLTQTVRVYTGSQHMNEYGGWTEIDAMQLKGTHTAPIVPGCMNTSYIEFNPFANIDDGSCATTLADASATPMTVSMVTSCEPYEWYDNLLAESGVYPNLSNDTILILTIDCGIEGCLDVAYVEYNAAASIDDGSCVNLWENSLNEAIDAQGNKLSITDVTACDSYSWNGNTYTESGTYADTIGSGVASVGDIIGGGVVFWVNPENPSTGLTISLTDMESTAQFDHWGWIGTPNVTAMGTEVGDGQQNSVDIMSNYTSNANGATHLCDQYTGGSYSDWFLPSRGEWIEIYNNKAAIESALVATGGEMFTVNGDTDRYWTSTQSVDGARGVHFRISDGYIDDYGWKDWTLNVRAARYFTMPATNMDSVAILNLTLDCMVEGCTDGAYMEYNANATVDDGSCATAWQSTLNNTQSDLNNSNYANTVLEGENSDLYNTTVVQASYIDSVNIVLGQYNDIVTAYGELETLYENNYTGVYGSITIDLLEGWNLIGYNLIFESSPEDQLNEIVNNVMLMKNNDGQVYWPEYGFNGMGNMKPGQGYLIKMYDNAQLTFDNE